MPGALEGIRIVDLTNIILGPYGTMLLADQGADVIKVEAPEGDAVRHIGKPGKTPGMGPTYLYVNRNKRSLCLDLKNPAARAALLKVVEGADAFVHALRPQAIEGLGLGYEAIRKIKPDIVYVGAYGYSADGPYGKLPAYDDAIQARFGIADLMGRAAGDDVPALSADHPRRQDGGPHLRLRHAVGPDAPPAHRRGPVRRGADVRDHGRLADGRASVGAHLQRRGRGRLHAAAGPHPQALPHPGRLDGDPALQRQALEQLLRDRRPARGAEGPALFDPQRPFPAHQRHVRHGRGAGADQDHGRMGEAPRQGADPQRPGVAAGRPVRRPASGVAPALQEVPASQRRRDHDGRAAHAHEPHAARHPHHGAAAGRRFARACWPRPASARPRSRR